MSDQDYKYPPEAEQHLPSLGADPYGPDVGFRRVGVPGPTAAYVEVDDTLLWESFGSVAAQTIQLSIRLLRADGVIVPFFFPITVPNTPNVAASLTIKLAAGYILSATVFAPSHGPGACFTRLSIQRGTGTSDVTRGQVLLSGYPNSFAPLAYPGSPLTTSVQGAGKVQFIPVTSPAAGADWTFTVPNGQNIMLRGVQFRLTTSAAALNREPILLISDGTNIAARISVAALIAPSIVAFCNFAPGDNGLGVAVNPFVVQTGMPMFTRLNQGFTVSTSTVNLAAADQYDQIVIQAEIWSGN